MFWIAILYSLTLFLPIASDVGVWTNNLSHAFAIPAIFVGGFLAAATLAATVASTLFHAADTLGYQGQWLRRLDHGLATYLIFAATAHVWYKRIPASASALLAIAGIVPAAVLTTPRVYPPMAAFALVLATIVYSHKERSKLLDKSYLLFALALAARALPATADKAHAHSIWHALAFTAVYYAALYTPDSSKPFPCKWVLVPMAAFMALFLAYLAHDTPYALDNQANGTCVFGDRTHCGTCGTCSNTHDYHVYANTSNTLTGDARSCALSGLFGGDEQACLEKTGLSHNCTKCWVRNMHCTRKNCLYPCAWELFYPVSGSRLSRCLACDEHHCVEDFLTCAGMSRRRAGIRTDIRRDHSEICETNTTLTTLTPASSLG